MPVDFVPPQLPSPCRVVLLGAATQGWYSASDEDRRQRALPRFQAVVEEWRALGAVPLGTLDDDLFMVGEPGSPEFTWYLMFDVPSFEVVAAMIQRVRESVDGVRLDEFVRFEARIGRPFFLLEG
ncbi:hypothetical protein [Patulibacter defluvii]|uniref:hypothetical protein n=1 Tax=Patulibacter defluvii TaxID=3095358 RepID=UPI002A7501ED|nr:hypothetical protein [Patulibacter sp. DM4]